MNNLYQWCGHDQVAQATGLDEQDSLRMPPRFLYKRTLYTINDGKWNAQQVAERGNNMLTQNTPLEFVIRLISLL